MAELSKTARASMRVGEGNSRFATAWIFESKPGKMQTRPFMTFYGKNGKQEALEAIKGSEESFYVVAF